MKKGCAKLPKEHAENKKLFTRLWVHETLRAFYDRLTTEDQRETIFQSIQHCVRTIFRENFDSAFEHLGKVDGHVAQQNLRNLLFGTYLAEDSNENSSYQEVQSTESFEKLIQQKCASVYLNKYSLEIVSHVNHVLTSSNSHAILCGHGGEGRTTLCKNAALLTDVQTFQIPDSDSYDFDNWRSDLRRLLKSVGQNNKSIMIFCSACQLKKQDFLLKDICSFLTKGEVSDLFNLEEKHKLNEHIYQRLVAEDERNIMAELTPNDLYDKFVMLCRTKIHIVIVYNVGDPDVDHLLKVTVYSLVKF